MIEAPLPIPVFSPPAGGIGSNGDNLDDHGFSLSRQFSGMMSTLEKTGSITKTAEEAAKDAITLAEEFFKKQTIIPYGYEIVNNRWMSSGKTLAELGVGERIERVIRAQDRMASDSSITQAVTVSEDTGSGRSYVYLFSKDKDDKGKISALAVEYNGTTNELATLLHTLSRFEQAREKTIDFSQPLFFTEGKEIGIKDFFQAAFDSFATNERRSQMSPYLTRLDRDVSNFPNLVIEHQKQVEQLARKIEEDLISNQNVAVGLATAVNGLNRVVETWISQERSDQSAKSEQVFYETRTRLLEYSFTNASSVTLDKPKALIEVQEPTIETSLYGLSQEAVGLLGQAIIMIITAEDEEIVDRYEIEEGETQPFKAEPSRETIIDITEPMILTIGVVLELLSGQELSSFNAEEKIVQPSQIAPDETTVMAPDFISDLILLMLILTPSQDADVTGIWQKVSSRGLGMEARIVFWFGKKENETPLSKPKLASISKPSPKPDGRLLILPHRLPLLGSFDTDSSGVEGENNVVSKIQNLLADNETFLDKMGEIKTIADDLLEFFRIIDKDTEGPFFIEESLEKIKLFLKVYQDEETPKEIKQLAIFFLCQEFVKLCENQELIDRYIELIVQDPILKRRYEELVGNLVGLVKMELSFVGDGKKLSIVELVEMMLINQHRQQRKRIVSFPRQGIIYLYHDIGE